MFLAMLFASIAYNTGACCSQKKENRKQVLKRLVMMVCACVPMARGITLTVK